MADVSDNLSAALNSFGLSLLLYIVLAIAHSGGIFEGTLEFFAAAAALCVAALVAGQLIFPASRPVAMRASGLGVACGVGLLLSLSRYLSLQSLGIYVVLLSFFHWSEYVSVALTNPKSLQLESFLLNHSIQYWLAAGASWLEFTLELWLWPGMKQFGVISSVGLIICLIGEGLRKTAMFTAGHNFTHLIQYRKRDDHELVQSGIYSVFRHPSYVGWFWWSIGTQVVLVNPVCTVAYAVASWKFFNSRICDEEISLINFFGEDYVAYQRSVPTGIPFIQGFKEDV